MKIKVEVEVPDRQRDCYICDYNFGAKQPVTCYLFRQYLTGGTMGKPCPACLKARAEAKEQDEK